jgi:hypothetical protein
MRELNTIQKREKLNKVYALDEKTCGNASYSYAIEGLSPNMDDETVFRHHIIFQKGARKDTKAIQGVLECDLLEIVRDRLKGFQSGEFATEYNAKALEHIEIALMYMNRRVEDRIERNVLGTYRK